MTLFMLYVYLAGLLLLTHLYDCSVASTIHTEHSTAAPSCKRWFEILDDLQYNVFGGGKCGDPARKALRLTFHDGIGRSAALKASGRFPGGGADGSIIKFADVELEDPANTGLEDIVYVLRSLADDHGVSYGDIIQFAGAVALSNCPGSPRLAFYAGRAEAIAPSPPKLAPFPTDSAETILSRMADAGFTAEDTVALMAAHSVAVQKIIDPSAVGAPLDSTPEAFDSQFYLETLLRGTSYPGKGRSAAEAKSPVKHVFRLASDAALARHKSTACYWEAFVGDQERMRGSFRKAMEKLANQGHSNLADCSSVIPAPKPWNRPPKLPRGKNVSDIEQTCTAVQFPPLA
ncbi:class II peroxidase [Laetiporus sulphureus 93-53]|uniref:Peroxidase n=1 Tax=Laetiporus sulphureus 93-53 TaxID=1314785 RepID=A0A165HRG0_9APHY|nr:class II peroxidase [Laetiporus sulphureus 93-53]KZT12083.1 class II peroxidase [Laetiporus sulphureus 93-53]